jgi:hypothetical protein
MMMPSSHNAPIVEMLAAMAEREIAEERFNLVIVMCDAV